MGEALKALELAAPQLHRLDQVLLGPRPRRRQPGQPDRHAQPQVPDAGDRRLAEAHAARLHRPRLLPPARSEDADRGDRLGDERHDHARQGALLGHQRVGRGRHPRRLGHRRQAPPAQAGDGAAAVPPVPSQARRAGVRAPLRRHRPRPDDLEPARQRPPDRQVQERHPGRQPRRAREHGLARQGARPTRRRTRRSASSKASPPSSARRSRRWRSPGSRRTRMSRR